MVWSVVVGILLQSVIYMLYLVLLLNVIETYTKKEEKTVQEGAVLFQFKGLLIRGVRYIISFWYIWGGRGRSCFLVVKGDNISNSIYV